MNLVDLMQIYELQNSKDLFDGIVLDSRIDRDVLTDTIKQRLGAMTPLFNTSGCFKQFSDNFFKRNQLMFAKLIDTETTTYDYLKNYDRKDETTTTRTVDLVDSNSGGMENKVSAYNESEYQPKDLTTDTTATKHTGTDTVRVEQRVYGDAGVSMVQDMIDAQRRVVKFNTIDFIVNMYRKDLMLCVY